MNIWKYDTHHGEDMLILWRYLEFCQYLYRFVAYVENTGISALKVTLMYTDNQHKYTRNFHNQTRVNPSVKGW